MSNIDGRWKPLARLSHDDTPSFEHIDDWVLIGVSHLQRPQDDKKKAKRFEEEVSGANHVLFEGASRVVPIALALPFYEGLALRIARGQTHFLEEKLDWIDLGASQGLSTKEVAIYNFLTGLGLFVDWQNVPGGLRPILTMEGVERYVAQRKYSRPEINACLGERWGLVEIPVFMRDFGLNSLDLALNLGELYTSHFCLIRNREHLGPGLTQHRALSGKKAVITGFEHTPELSMVLHDQVLPSIPRWRTWLRDRPDEYQKAAEYIHARYP